MMAWRCRDGLESLTISLHFNFVAGRKESLEADNQLGMAVEEVRHAPYDAGLVNVFPQQFFSRVEKIVVDLRLIPERVFHLKSYDIVSFFCICEL